MFALNQLSRRPPFTPLLASFLCPYLAVGLLTVTAACTRHQQAAEKADCNTTSPTTDSLTAGRFSIRELIGCKIHIYMTDDPMADASYIIECEDSLITLEQPLFKVNAEAFDRYLNSLGKPVAARIADFHLGNTGTEPIVMPQGMPEVVKGDAYSGMMAHFAGQFGDAIVDMPTGPVTEVPFDVPVVYNYLPFTFYHGAANDFPGANILIGGEIVYSHWAPEAAHISNLYAGSLEAIDQRIAELKQLISTGAELFIGGHGKPSNSEDVRFRIEYLNRVKELRKSQPDATSFAAALVEEFPDLPGAEGVGALADALYN